MAFCLPIESSKAFLTALKDGTIDPAKLIDMNSAERRSFFEKIVGKEDAAEVNAMFESKLLLQDQKRGLVTWAKKVGGISEPVRRDMIARIEKLDRVLDPVEERAFLADLAAQKLGVRVSFEEAQRIANLSKAVTEARAKIDRNTPDGSDSRMEYGARAVELENYVADLKREAAKPNLQTVKEGLKTKPVTTVKEGVEFLAGAAKSLKASLDNSFWMRQGFRTMFTHPVQWGKNFAKSWGDIYESLKGNDQLVRDAVRAEIISRENALNGNYKRMKLDIGTGEEAYPTLLPEKIPVLGRFFKASNVAFESGAMRMRADIADIYLRKAQEHGVDLTDPLQIESLGRLTNSLTGRGSLGNLEKIGKDVNVLFFSPKLVKSQLDFLTAHALDPMSTFARQQAAINLIKVVGTMAGVIATINALRPGSVETDPRSTDFGKVKVGNTRFDITGGAGSLIVLGSRLATGSTKTSKGDIRPINEKDKKGNLKFGATTGVDLLVNFMQNKLSPAAAVVRDLLQQSTFTGETPTFAAEATNLFVPLPLANTYELLTTPDAANPLLGALADAIGISTNTYEPKK